MSKIVELTGRVFGRLTVLSFSHLGDAAYWLCQCECGEKKAVRGWALTGGRTRSCGCLREDRKREPRQPGKYAGCGVYSIVCNGEICYIGSTKSLTRRRLGHINMMRTHTHNNRNLQSIFNDFGEESLEFKWVIRCAEDHLLMYEQIAIDAFNPKCNIYRYAGSSRGSKLSPERLAKLSRKGIPVRESTKQKIRENRPNIRAVQCIETGQVFRSATEAANWLPRQNKRSTAAAICNVCKGRSKTVSGFTWAYADQ